MQLLGTGIVHEDETPEPDIMVAQPFSRMQCVLRPGDLFPFPPDRA
jgi:hypothetical protein